MREEAKGRGGAVCNTYTSNSLGQLESKSSCGRVLLQYTYDKDGNIQTIKDISGKTTRYTYDLLGRTATVGDDTGTVASYRYHVTGRPEEVSYGNGIRTTYQYDSGYNLQRMVTQTKEGEVLAEYDYQYDGNGNQIEKKGSILSYLPAQTVQAVGTLTGDKAGTDRMPVHTLYGWDSRGQLVHAEYNGRTEDFAYDRAGNRISRTITEGGHQQAETYTYNRKNQLTGLHTAKGDTYFTYNGQGRYNKGRRHRRMEGPPLRCLEPTDRDIVLRCQTAEEPL